MVTESSNSIKGATWMVIDSMISNLHRESCSVFFWHMQTSRKSVWAWCGFDSLNRFKLSAHLLFIWISVMKLDNVYDFECLGYCHICCYIHNVSANAFFVVSCWTRKSIHNFESNPSKFWSAYYYLTSYGQNLLNLLFAKICLARHTSFRISIMPFVSEWSNYLWSDVVYRCLTCHLLRFS